MKNSTLIKKIIGTVIAIIIIYLIFLILYFSKNNSLAFPHPNEIIKNTFLLLGKGSTYKSLGLSILRLILCLLVSFLIGLILATISFKFELCKNIINPFILIFRSVPVISIAVLFIIMFGLKNACYFITSIMLIPIFYENIYNSFKNVPKDIVDAYSIDSSFNFKVLFKLYIPYSMKDIRVAFIECVGLGFKVLVMSEYLSGKISSIGYSILEAYQNNIEMVYVYSWTLLLVIISIIVTELCNKIKNRI